MPISPWIFCAEGIFVSCKDVQMLYIGHMEGVVWIAW